MVIQNKRCNFVERKDVQNYTILFTFIPKHNYTMITSINRQQ